MFLTEESNHFPLFCTELNPTIQNVQNENDVTKCDWLTDELL